jgi:hypothetical protein
MLSDSAGQLRPALASLGERDQAESPGDKWLGLAFP